MSFLTLLTAAAFTMAEETEKPEEEEGVSQEDFIKEMASTTGVSDEPTIPEDATDEQKRLATVEQRLAVSEFKSELLENLALVRSNYPKATDAQIQKYVRTAMTRNIAGNLQASNEMFRTTAESEQSGEGEEGSPETLETVETEDNGAGEGGLPQVAGSYGGVIRQVLGNRA